MKNYGVDHNFKSSVVKQKREQTWLKNLNASSPYKSKKVQEKIKQTNLQRHGVENPWNGESQKHTMVRLYGAENPYQSEAIKEKIKQTNLKNHGVEYPMQNQEIFEKTIKKSKSFKEYIFPSGKIAKVQGYEPQALNYLINIELIKEEDIALRAIEGKPTIKYIENNKERFYFPDIFIKSQNRIIEVKSEWTFKEEWRKNVHLKLEACKNLGYKADLYVMNFTGEVLQKIN